MPVPQERNGAGGRGEAGAETEMNGWNIDILSATRCATTLHAHETMGSVGDLGYNVFCRRFVLAELGIVLEYV